MRDFSEGLIVTIGAPGSGKSTWAEKNLPEHCLRLERDRFRECLFGSRRSYHNHQFPLDQRSHLITETMVTAFRNWPKFSWAVTDTGIAYKSVEPFIQSALLRMVPVQFVTFERTVEYLEEINTTRPVEHRIPQDILIEMIAKINDPAAWWRELRDDPNFEFIDGTS